MTTSDSQKMMVFYFPAGRAAVQHLIGVDESNEVHIFYGDKLPADSLDFDPESIPMELSTWSITSRQIKLLLNGRNPGEFKIGDRVDHGIDVTGYCLGWQEMKLIEFMDPDLAQINESCAELLGINIRRANGLHYRADTGIVWDPLNDDVSAMHLLSILIKDYDFELESHNDAACLGSDSMEYSIEVPWQDDRQATLRIGIAQAAAAVLRRKNEYQFKSREP